MNAVVVEMLSNGRQSNEADGLLRCNPQDYGLRKGLEFKQKIEKCKLLSGQDLLRNLRGRY